MDKLNKNAKAAFIIASLVALSPFISGFRQFNAVRFISYGMPIIVVVLLIYYVNYRQTYWKRQGIQTKECHFLVGHMLRRLGISEPFWKFYDEMYYKYNAKEFCGSYDFLKPALIVGNLQIVKNILVRDFECFSQRRTLALGKVCPIADEMLSNAHGTKWYQIRKSLSPTFTTMKLRQLFPLICERCQILINKLENAAENETEVKTKEYCGTFTMETIMSCAFGIKFDERTSDVSEYTKMGRKIFQLSPLRALKIIILLIAPMLASVLGTLGLQFSSLEFLFFENKVRQTLYIRKQISVRRGDFLDLMLDSGKLSENAIVSQAILFLLAGYDNTANTISFVLHLLAVNPEVQQKLRRNISNAIAEESDPEVDEYAKINDCQYLDAVIKESLRLYPVAPITERTCTKCTKIPGTNVIIEEGQVIIVPIWNLHRDPEYWQDHKKFKPERFLDNPNNPAFMPFGLGPRNCIGRRFANLVVKVAIFKILTVMKVIPSESTIDPPSLDGRILTLQTTNGLPLKFSSL